MEEIAKNNNSVIMESTIIEDNSTVILDGNNDITIIPENAQDNNNNSNDVNGDNSDNKEESSSVSSGIILEVMTLLDLEKDALKCIDDKEIVPRIVGGGAYCPPYQGGGAYYNNGMYYNTQYNEEKDERTIYFYEFSNINNLPKIFHKVSEFLSWAEECKISVSDYQRSQLKKNPCTYCACYKTNPTLMIRSAYNDLKNALEPSVYGGSSCASSVYARDYTNSYPRDYDYYDWD